MMRCTKTGSRRFLCIESHPKSILRFRRDPAPCARLVAEGALEGKETSGRPALVGRAWPAPRNLLAADPASLGNNGLRIPLPESLPRHTAASSPLAPGG